MHSIGTRIAVGFYALVSLIVVLAAFTYADLRYLEGQIRQGVTIAAFVEQVMEMRRYEKNFFLYGRDDDLTLAHASVDGASALWSANADLLDGLCARQPCAGMAGELASYRSALGGLGVKPAKTADDAAREDAVRAAGHRLSELAQGLGQREREHLSGTVEQSGRWWLALAVGIGLGGALLGTLLARGTVRPLRQLEASLAPIAAGRFNALQAPSQDREIQSFATAFNRMLVELENRRRQLLQSEKLASLGVLVSGVAHELNNPLSNISMPCQLALEELHTASREQIGNWVRQIDEQTRRAQRIVLALSDYARRRPLTLEPVVLTEVVEQTLLLVRKHLGPQVRIVRDLPPGLSVRTDRQHLQQVLINLLKNAVEADMEATALTITFAARRFEPGAADLPAARMCLGKAIAPEAATNYVLVSVADTGPGMAPEVLDHIFDPFFTTREVGRGMGLGLYIVQELVQELEGCIAVESVPGAGTRFVVALPGVSRELAA